MILSAPITIRVTADAAAQKATRLAAGSDLHIVKYQNDCGQIVYDLTNEDGGVEIRIIVSTEE